MVGDREFPSQRFRTKLMKAGIGYVLRLRPVKAYKKRMRIEGLFRDLRGLYALIKGLLSQDDPLVREFLRGYISLNLIDPCRLRGNPGQAFNPGKYGMCQVKPLCTMDDLSGLSNGLPLHHGIETRGIIGARQPKGIKIFPYGNNR